MAWPTDFFRIMTPNRDNRDRVLSMVSGPILHIALSGPFRTCFDYLPPAELLTSPVPGCRFEVPFGKSNRIGILLSISEQSTLPPSKLKRAKRQLDAQPLLLEADIRLLRWAADYYQHPFGDVIFQALPSNLRKWRTLRMAKPAGLRLTQAGKAVDLNTLGRAPKQVALIQTLMKNSAGLSKIALKEEHAITPAVVRSLMKKGWIEPCDLQTQPETPTAPPKAKEGHPLNPHQQQAVDKVSHYLGTFRPFLLNGVTGSGKTEVYLHLVEAVVARGQQALLLAPEIGLTPQLLQRFRERMGDKVAVLHSGLADGERERIWQSMRCADQQVLIGTRSAIFSPLPKLGLIIVDEEHDLSYKQQEGFRYSARDLSLVRAQQSICPVLLGSATPSLESLHNVEEGRYHLLRLPNRAAHSQMPKLGLVNICDVRLNGGLSPALIKHLKLTLAAGEQAMLFLNRRGYAPMLTCHACGWLTDCPRCDARMTHHRQQNLLWCHHCGHQQRVPQQCPSCGSPDLRPIGQGTERVEESLQQIFPDTPLARIDRDSTSRKGSLEKLLAQIKAGVYPILLGTQMLAKGHHFPAVTLVAILDVDQGLFGADFRASERMAQLILQVSGRAGRAERPGKVLIQTRHPDHPLMQLLTTKGYDAFSEVALQERRNALLPPYSHQVLIRAEATKAEHPERFLNQILEAGLKIDGAANIEFWGPVPAPMERRAGKTRAHLLIQSSHRQPLHQWLEACIKLIDELPQSRQVRWSIDVDPQEML
jgi:primosomal protein N' (replication factor Y) (superfamily II helicase)